MQAAEAAKKVEAAKSKAADGPQLENHDDDDLDPNQYYERRVRTLATIKANGRNPYPHKFQITMYLPEYVAKYKDLAPGSHLTEETVSVAGANSQTTRMHVICFLVLLPCFLLTLVILFGSYRPMWKARS